MRKTSEKKVLCFGLVMADVLVSGLSRLPQNWEEAVGGERSVISVGGGATNSARTFGRLGEAVDLLGRVGGDYFGEFVCRDTKADGVNCKALLIDETASTGVAVGLVHKGGQRCFVTAQGANRNIDKTDFERVDLDDYDFLHINGYFQFPKIEPDLRAVLEDFHGRGGKISLDTASADPFGRWYKAIEPFADCIDYLFLNNTQLMEMAGEATVEKSAEKMLSRGVKTVIAKLGGEGCQIYQAQKETVCVPALKVEAVDTTGAGDSFDAAFITGLRQGWDFEHAARFANTVAGLNCSKLGATAGVLGWEQAVDAMQAFYGE